MSLTSCPQTRSQRGPDLRQGSGEENQLQASRVAHKISQRVNVPSRGRVVSGQPGVAAKSMQVVVSANETVVANERAVTNETMVANETTAANDTTVANETAPANEMENERRAARGTDQGPATTSRSVSSQARSMGKGQLVKRTDAAGSVGKKRKGIGERANVPENGGWEAKKRRRTNSDEHEHALHEEGARVGENGRMRVAQSAANNVRFFLFLETHLYPVRRS